MNQISTQQSSGFTNTLNLALVSSVLFFGATFVISQKAAHATQIQPTINTQQYVSRGHQVNPTCQMIDFGAMGKTPMLDSMGKMICN